MLIADEVFENEIGGIDQPHSSETTRLYVTDSGELGRDPWFTQYRISRTELTKLGSGLDEI